MAMINLRWSGTHTQMYQQSIHKKSKGQATYDIKQVEGFDTKR